MHRDAQRAGIKIRATSPRFLIRSLYLQGLLSRAEFDRLDETMPLRTGAAHGLAVPGLTAAVPGGVIEVARRLLAEESNARGA